MNDQISPSEAPFQAVLKALLDPDSTLAPGFLYRLSDLEGQDAQELKEAWNQIPVWRRRALMEDIEQLADDNYLLSFESICRIAIDDEDAQVRFLAVRPMFMYEPVDLIQQLLEMMDGDSDENVRAVCASTLGKFVYLGEIEDIPATTKDQVVDCLLLVTEGEDSIDVRRRALEALGFSSHKAVPVLIDQAFNSEETNWLVSALFAMGRTYDARWIPKVISMLDHHLPAIRFEATRAAGELEIKDAREHLLDLLDDTDDDVRMAAAWSLSQIGGEGVRKALEDLSKSVEKSEEADNLQNALDNLIFNEEMKLFGLMEFTEDDDDPYLDF